MQQELTEGTPCLKGLGDKKQIKSFVRIFGALSEAQFDKVWRGKDYDSFQEFIFNQVFDPNSGSGSFLVTLAIPKNRIIWVFYKFREAIEKRRCIQIDEWKISVAMPENYGDCECPEQWKGHPVWRAHLD